MKLTLVLLLTLILILPAYAQEVTPESTHAAALAYGTQVVNELDSTRPFVEYVFEGLRGDVASLSLEVMSGDLDPMLTLIDPLGGLLATRDDTALGGQSGARGIRIEALRLPRSGLYRIIVGRFGYQQGSTEGSYRFTLERVGASSASGSGLRYGDSLINSITDSQPQLYYSFRARRGDIVAIQMRRVSGDLDPVLQLVNQNSFIIAQNDDVPGSGSQDAEISGYLVETDGTYVIIASRYGQGAGRSTGSFVLTLQATDESGLGTNALAAIDLEIGDTVTGTLSDERYEQFYRFSGQQGQTITITMTRGTGGDLDTFLVLANAALQEISSNDDSFGTQNSTIENFTLPANGAYYLIATRYQRASGTTSGPYTLEVEAAGASNGVNSESSGFTGLPAATAELQYNSSVSGVINDTTPQVLYSFQGSAGDVISVTMSRMDGDLDSRVAILDGELRELASDDDSGGSQNSLIDRFVLPATDTYYLQASRFSGQGLPTSGGYLLVLSQRFD
jgi:hypothetical protein